MKTLEAIAKRVSVREFKNDPISKEIIEGIIDAGRRAPSARAVEPWEFIVVDDKKALNTLTDLIPNGPFIKDSACCIVVYCKDTKYYLEDGVAATENMLLVISDFGLGACWVAGDKKPYAEAVSKLLSVPKDLKLISLIPIGLPKKDISQTKNRDLKSVLHWGKFEAKK